MAKINVILRDETQYWCEDVVKRAGRLFGVYLYDPEVHVHCCEFTPSYELVPVGTVVERHDGDDQAVEALEDDIRTGDAQSDGIVYIHCHDVDAMPKITRGSFAAGTYPLHHLHGDDWESVEEAEECWRASPDY